MSSIRPPPLTSKLLPASTHTHLRRYILKRGSNYESTEIIISSLTSKLQQKKLLCKAIGPLPFHEQLYLKLTQRPPKNKNETPEQL